MRNISEAIMIEFCVARINNNSLGINYFSFFWASRLREIKEKASASSTQAEIKSSSV